MAPSTTAASWRGRLRFLLRSVGVFILLFSLTMIRVVLFTGRRMTTTSTVTTKSSVSFQGRGSEGQGQLLDEDEEKAFFYNTTWPPLQQNLCGTGAPNLMLSTMIFQLARSEAFFHNNATAPPPTRPIDPAVFNHSIRTKTGNPTETLASFFAGDFGATVFHGTNPATNQTFTTVFVKIWKCGNNQIRWMEKKLYKHYNGTYTERMPLRKILGHYLPALEKETTKDKKIHAPCIYTAVRDPISHFLSGYNEMEFRQLEKYNKGDAHRFPANATPAPYHLFVPYSSDSPGLRKKRFSAFVEDLLLEEPVFASNRVYSHFFAMSRVLSVVAKYRSTLTGYIPSLSNITSTWPTFAASTCQDFPSLSDIPRMTKQGQHRSSDDQLGLYKAAREVWEEAGPVARSLCLLHAFDYACFEDLPDRLPALCRSVFRDHSKTILDFGKRKYLNY